MHTNQFRLVNSRCLYERQLSKLNRPCILTQIRLVNSRCLHATFLKVEAIIVCKSVRLVNSRCLYVKPLEVNSIGLVYLPKSPSQLALFVRDNSPGGACPRILTKSAKSIRVVCTIGNLKFRLFNSRCLHETTLMVEAIVRVNLPSPRRKEPLRKSANPQDNC